MADRLNKIRERWAAATPGPWSWWADPDMGGTYEWLQNESLGQYEMLRTDADQEPSEANADAIANAPEDVAWLLAEAERLRGLLAEPDDDLEAVLARAVMRAALTLEGKGARLDWHAGVRELLAHLRARAEVTRG